MAKPGSTSFNLKLFIVYSSLFLVLTGSSFAIISRIVNQRVENMIIAQLENSTDSVLEIIRNYAQLTIRNHLNALVQKQLGVIETLDLEYADTPVEAKTKASDSLLSVKIGEEGYFYVIDQSGTVLIHPSENLIGVSVQEYDFVKKQIQEKSGYLEYEWQNPGDEDVRSKVLSMGYFEPWDWIVTASAYRDELSSLIQVDELRKSIELMRSGQSGYSYVMNMDGDIIIHPQRAGQNINTMDLIEDQDISFFNEMLDRKNGYLRYQWPDPDLDRFTEKLVFFKYIPEYEWIIGSTVSLEDFHFIFRDINIILIIVLIISALIYLILSRKISILMTMPLFDLVQFIEKSKGSDYTERFNYSGHDEFAKLAEQVNSFLTDLENEKGIRQIVEENNRILAQFPEGNPYPVIRIDPLGTILYANPAALNLFTRWNLELDEPVPDDLYRPVKTLTDSFGTISYQRDGSFYDILVSYFASQDAFYLFFSDVTVKKQIESQLLLSESVFDHSLEGIVVTDPDACILRVNRAFLDITGFEEGDIQGQNPRIFQSGLHSKDYYTGLWEILIRDGHWSGEMWNRRKSGESYPVLMTINSLKNEQGDLIHYVGMAKDISEIKASQDLLERQAYYDILTGLPNRVLVMDRLNQAIANADRNKTSLGIIFLDLDNFKNINDSMGHNVGDVFLKKIGERISLCCRDQDTVARLGGDEFLILMPGIFHSEDVVEVAKRLQVSLGAPIEVDRYEVHPSASMGITFYPDDGKNPQLLLKNADMAMYKAKSSGKGTYSLFNKAMNKGIQQRMKLEGQMRTALERNEFKIAYQPKVSTADGSIVGAEALIRWDNPESGLISPGDFIPLAEENGFILELGDWILKKVLDDYPDMRQKTNDSFEIAVNLSGRQFRDAELMKRICTIMDDSGLPYGSVNFEITENMAMENSQSVVEILDELHNLNIKISIDDFGTGYSSLSYLKRFKTHCLKIDKSFTDELPDDPEGTAIVRHIINLGHTLGMIVVAEGVEKKDQLQFLIDAGCDSIQGYYYSKPLYKDDFLSYLDNNVRGLLEKSQ